ncbi:MAG TPA: DUF4352 domain-containing protein [Anaerolineae bacterium]|nr:DUF4352 domain-containing protein [Anaerolineae bacterium]
MDDLGSYRVPREAPMGRELRIEQRRTANKSALIAIGGIIVLCVCLGLGILGVWAGSQLSGGGGPNVGLNNPTAPRASSSKTPTLVPYGRSAMSDSGLRVTVTAFQRPLPAENVEIPDGQELVLVTVRLDNVRTTGAPIKYDPEDFALVSPDGDHFAVNTTGITTGENLKSGEVGPGKSAKGDLIFYIYSDVPELQLAWTAADGKTRLYRLSR